jgi:thiosulfate/3-mercaptopyruvate sulfurtransferase
VTPPDPTIELDELVRRVGDGSLVLLDVRTPGEYDGTRGSGCDPRQGHIPHARNVDTFTLLRSAPDELEALVGAPAGAEVVAYCHSGQRSAMATEVLRSHGYAARNYVGSWHEWSRHDELPIET